MSADFYSLDYVEPLAGPGELNFPRARHIADAIQRHRDFELVGVGKGIWFDSISIECLFVEATCDRVPKHNSYGLRYRERLALLVRAEREELPVVLALRKDFPRLVHTNRVTPDTPVHLCLYFEPVAAVLRTWTPESFLHRIRWWIEMNARGELHLADQPLDHLFFSSKFELILPWNYDTLREQTPEFVLARSDIRPDNGVTYFLLPKQANTHHKITSAICVDLSLPAVVNSAVEVDPDSLGQLADLLADREIELLPQMQPKLRALVNEHGAIVQTDQKFTAILLHIPITREAGGNPEKVTHRAFLLPNDPLELGVATGALMRHEGKYYSSAGILNAPEATAWRDFKIMPVEVLSANTSEQARRQSGFVDAGPAGVVVGAGSLGSAVLNLWGRSGWGNWTVIDKDHVKPHNLSRHTAIAKQIGDSKVHAVVALNQEVMQGASVIVPIVADATCSSNAMVTSALTDTALVVDASAALEYPRYASTIDSFARHASIFVTPSGSAGVALIEDKPRNHRLRTLEAQYYRALIQNDWGRSHLVGNLGTYWSGASCRDISMVLPYARVMGHACTFAEHLPSLISSEQARIRVWQQESQQGNVVAYEVPVEVERSLQLDDDLTVFLDAGVERSLRECREQGLPNETGGVLLGYYDYNVKALVVVAALPAPPDSKATPSSFERGIEGLKEAVEEAARRTAGIVGYVGEWHSHPQGHSASPSPDDWIQLIHLALGMGDDGLPGVQLIVGENDLQLLKGAMHP